MTNTKKHAAGTPIWADLSTTNLEGAMDFYKKIFGWESVKGPAQLGFYTNASLNGRRVAGMVPKQNSDPSPSAWTQYLATDNADQTAANIVKNRGTMMYPPMTVVDNGHSLGRMGVATDPDGGVFGIWEAMEFGGTETENEAGAPVWTELRSKNAANARDFFEDTFGLPLSRMEGTAAEYYTAVKNDHMVYGIFQMDETMAGLPSHWSPHFGVQDIDASCNDIKTNGGKVLHGPEESPYGRWASVADPYGATFTIMEVGQMGAGHTDAEDEQ